MQADCEGMPARNDQSSSHSYDQDTRRNMQLMMKHTLRACSLALGALAYFAFCCSPALAEKRVALVMGNSAYKNTLRLTNPVNDAALIGDMFKKAGFDAVDVKTDLNASEMRRALREFAGRVRDADMAVIYYAGHGIELDGTNYLIPTDAALETDADVYDEALPIDRVLVSIEPAKQLRLVILDACRDNPFAKTMKRTVASRAIGRGLAKVEPTSPNTMIAFAAKAGSTGPTEIPETARSPRRLQTTFQSPAWTCARRSASCAMMC
ncbi:UNVERIFIED_ORG: putative caspase-like protein [Bradyrhizobium japonicum]